LVAADAEKAVLRTIAAESAIFVLLNISYLPTKPLRHHPGFPDNSVPTSGAERHDRSGHTQEETAKRLGYSWRSKANASFQITLS
jgi:hypothetical protein